MLPWIILCLVLILSGNAPLAFFGVVMLILILFFRN